MSKSKEEIIKAVDDLQKRMEKMEDATDIEAPSETEAKDYKDALAEITKLKAQIKAMEEKEKEKPEDSDFGEDW